MAKNRLHPHLYSAGLVLMAAGLPTSKFLLSVSLIVLSAAWLIEGKWREKWRIAKTHRFLHLIFLFALALLVGLFYSNDLAYGWHDIKVKAPFIVLPLILFTTVSVNWARTWKLIRLVFVLAVVTETLYAYSIYLGWLPSKNDVAQDIRNIVPNISHIRLSLLICLAMVMLAADIRRFSAWAQVTGIVMFGWLAYFLYLIESATGLVILLGLLVYFTLYYLVNCRSLMRRVALSAVCLTLVIVSTSWVYKQVKDVQPGTMPALAQLDKLTASGEHYQHDVECRAFENGSFTWLYVAPNELRSAWEERSELPIDGADAKGQPVRTTLIRYLTSKGYRKDMAGVAKLNARDIENIEAGVANYMYVENIGLRRRLQEIIFEWDNYMQGNAPFGNSMAQRIEYWRLGWNIFSSSWITGVGTGDVQQSFDNEYNNLNYEVEDRYKLRAHNQFLTIAIATGIPGLLIFLALLFYPVFRYRKKMILVYRSFFLIAALSFMWEDTLETQAGIFFVAFFTACLYNVQQLMEHRYAYLAGIPEQKSVS